MITCENLWLEYPDGTGTKTILSNIDLAIKEDENVILLGPSGSGKSSLIYLLSSLRQPTKGNVFWKDQNLTKDTNHATDIRRAHFGFIFQMHFLLPYLNVIENALVGLNKYDASAKEQASEILMQLGLGDHLQQKIHQLSGGQRQRVAIARALMNEPDVIFADEPTASLDHETACEVMDILKHHKKNSILVMATHDTSILAGDERVIHVTNGQLVE